MLGLGPELAEAHVWYLAALAPAALITTRDGPGFGRLLNVPALGLLLGLGELLVSWLASASPRLRALAAATETAVLFAFAISAPRAHGGLPQRPCAV